MGLNMEPEITEPKTLSETGVMVTVVSLLLAYGSLWGILLHVTHHYVSANGVLPFFGLSIIFAFWNMLDLMGFIDYSPARWIENL